MERTVAFDRGVNQKTAWHRCLSVHGLPSVSGRCNRRGEAMFTTSKSHTTPARPSVLRTDGGCCCRSSDSIGRTEGHFTNRIETVVRIPEVAFFVFALPGVQRVVS